MTRAHLSSVAELWLGTMYRLRLVLCLVNKGVGAREEGSGVSSMRWKKVDTIL